MVWLALEAALADDVCPTCPFPDIASAVASVPPGGKGEFTVLAGSYSESATVVVPEGTVVTLSATGGGVTVTRTGAGPVFSVAGSLTLDGLSVTAFNDRTVESDGGEVILRDCVLYTLGSVDEGGTVLVENGSLTIEDSVFLDTSATALGGHVVARDSFVTVRDSLFRDGFARTGGALAFESTDGVADEVLVEDARFEDNLASESGGAIAVQGDVDLVVRRSVFLRNTADLGGAIAQRLEGADTETFEVAVEASRFEENVALADGGAIAFVDAPGRVDDSVFLDNVAVATGGAAYVGGGATSFRRNVFCGNEAAEGGAIASVSAEAQSWSNNRFLANEASRRGGAILHGVGQLTLDHGNLLGNAAPEGGAVVTSGQLDLRRSLFAFTEGGTAVATRREATVSSLYDAWWSNAADDIEGGNNSGTDVHADPRLTRFEPGLACDAVDDTYSWYGPLRDAAGGAGLRTDIDGSPADIGAYGGPDADPGPWVDDDQDGFPALFDCLEADIEWHPDPDFEDGVDVEVWYDGLDEDCDGASDYDQDRDGFDAEAYAGVDCDDLDPDVNPGATEQPGKGDQDCDGVEDADQDGYSPPEDCDDDDPRTHPGAVEDADPAVDRDCVAPADVVRPLVPAQCASAGAPAALPVALAALLLPRRRRAPTPTREGGGGARRETRAERYFSMRSRSVLPGLKYA